MIGKVVNLSNKYKLNFSLTMLYIVNLNLNLFALVRLDEIKFCDTSIISAFIRRTPIFAPIPFPS